MAPTPRLEVDKITCRFDGRDVVRDVSFTVRAGEVMCLLGPSGCGKSTTLRVIAGIERQVSGAVRADGATLSDDKIHLPPEARGVGLIFQDFALFPHLSVGQNVAFGLKASRPDVARRVGELLERVDLAGYADKAPHMLSGGEQQRVALARALAPRPRINRLRDGIRDETLQLLKEEGTAVVLVTHEPEEAMRMADQIALMRDGVIVQKGAPYNIYNAPADKAAAAFFSDVNVIRGTVQGALVDAPFGQFLAPGHPDGTAVEIVFRPQHVKIDFDRGGRGPNPTPQDGTPARGVVERARFMGHESLVEFRMDFDGSLLKATVPAVFLPKPGVPLWLTVRRDRCFVFAKKR
jgi:iron(III) transport system ATP-binding protein